MLKNMARTVRRATKLPVISCRADCWCGRLGMPCCLMQIPVHCCAVLSELSFRECLAVLRLLQNLHGHRRAASSLRGVKASRTLTRLLQNLHGHRRAPSSLGGVKASRPLTAEVLQEPLTAEVLQEPRAVFRIPSQAHPARKTAAMTGRALIPIHDRFVLTFDTFPLDA